MADIVWLTIDDVKARTTLPRTEINRLAATGDFPKAIEIAPGQLAWRESDIDAWIDARPIAEDIPGLKPRTTH
jgi:prophage regulatory protein